MGGVGGLGCTNGKSPILGGGGRVSWLLLVGGKTCSTVLKGSSLNSLTQCSSFERTKRNEITL